MNKYKLLIIICFFLVTLCLPRVTATVKNLNLLGKVIILDAGHGGKDEGASSGPIKESKLNLILTKKLEKELTSRGATVYLTRKDNKDLSTTTINRKRNDLYNRAKYINDISPDMYISIHLNASPSPSWRGLQVFYTGNNKEFMKVRSESIKNSKGYEIITVSQLIYKDNYIINGNGTQIHE